MQAFYVILLAFAAIGLAVVEAVFNQPTKRYDLDDDVKITPPAPPTPVPDNELKSTILKLTGDDITQFLQGMLYLVKIDAVDFNPIDLTVTLKCQYTGFVYILDLTLLFNGKKSDAEYIQLYFSKYKHFFIGKYFFMKADCTHGLIFYTEHNNEMMVQFLYDTSKS